MMYCADCAMREQAIMSASARRADCAMRSQAYREGSFSELRRLRHVCAIYKINPDLPSFISIPLARTHGAIGAGGRRAGKADRLSVGAVRAIPHGAVSWSAR